MSAPARIRRLHDDARGAVLTEFALILPLLLAILVGVIETTTLLRLDRKLLTSAQTVADLMTQEPELSTARVADIFRAAELVLAPFPEAELEIGVASVRFNEADGSPALDWQESRNGGSLPDALTLAAGMGAPGESLILVRLTYPYNPALGALGIAPFELEEIAMLRPRKSAVVARN